MIFNRHGLSDWNDPNAIFIRNARIKQITENKSLGYARGTKPARTRKSEKQIYLRNVEVKKTDKVVAGWLYSYCKEANANDLQKNSVRKVWEI